MIVGVRKFMDLKQQQLVGKRFEYLWQQGMTPWELHISEPLLSKFALMLEEKYPKGKILDIGCGDGWIGIELAKHGFKIWGIDSSKTAIKQARKNAKKSGLDQSIKFELGNALELPYESNFYDAVVDRGLFHHILPENRQIYLENVLRVLKKKAIMYLSVFSERNQTGIGQLFSRKKVEDLFGKIFAVVAEAEGSYPTDMPAHLLHFILERKS